MDKRAVFGYDGNGLLYAGKGCRRIVFISGCGYIYFGSIRDMRFFIGG